MLKTLGKRALIIYLSVIGIFSVAFGYILDYYFPNILSGMVINSDEKFNIAHQISAIVMLVTMGYFLLQRKIKGDL